MLAAAALSFAKMMSSQMHLLTEYCSRHCRAGRVLKDGSRAHEPWPAVTEPQLLSFPSCAIWDRLVTKYFSILIVLVSYLLQVLCIVSNVAFSRCHSFWCFVSLWVSRWRGSIVCASYVLPYFMSSKTCRLPLLRGRSGTSPSRGLE